MTSVFDNNSINIEYTKHIIAFKSLALQKLTSK